jgi:two-component sensor histidine kinase
MKNIVVFTLLLFSTYCFGQNENYFVDSLKNELNNPIISSKNKIDVLLAIGSNLRNSAPEKSINYCQKGIALAKKEKNVIKQAKGYELIGGAYYLQSKLDSAIHFSKKGLTLYQSINDAEGTANIYNLNGLIEEGKGNLEQSNTYYTKALVIYKRIDNKNGVANVLNNLAFIYRAEGYVDKEIEVLEQCLEITIEQNDSLGLPATLNNIGGAYRRKGFYLKALLSHERAAQIAIKTSNKNNEGAAYNYIGIIYKDIGEYETAIDYYLKSIEIKETINNPRGVYNSYLNIGGIFSEFKENEKALVYYEKAYNGFKRLGLVEKANLSLLSIAEVYNNKKEPQKMIFYAKRCLNIAIDNNLIKQQAQVKVILAAAYRLLNEDEKSLEIYKDILLNTEIDYVSTIYLNISRIFNNKKQYNTAQIYADSALVSAHRLENKIEALSLISSISFNQNSFEKAYYFQNEYINLKDSLDKKSQLSEVTTIEGKYELKFKKDSVTLELQQVNQFKEVQSNQIKLQYIVISAILVILSLLIYLFYNARSKNDLLNRNKEELEILNSKLTVQNVELEKSRNQSDMLRSELQHRVKNNMMSVESLLKMQAYQTTNPNVKAALVIGQNRIKAMSTLHKILTYREIETTNINMKDYLEKLINSIRESHDNKVQVENRAEDFLLEIKYAGSLGLIINELVENSYKHAFINFDRNTPQITIQFQKVNENFELTIKDNGSGFDEKDNNNSQSLGLELVNLLIEDLPNSTINRVSNNGTTYLIKFTN